MQIARRTAMTNSRKLSPYHNWTREELISRLHQLDSDALPRVSKESSAEPFSFSSHPRRKIALKFCYSGSEYNGLAFQKDYTPLPTVEGVLFDALAKTRLIDPDNGFEGCTWERCGRTDRGVSAAGQVISLWVRSAVSSSSTEYSTDQPNAEAIIVSMEEKQAESIDDMELPLMTDIDPPFSSCIPPALGTTTAASELSYIQILNRVLPSTIRIICWSPVSDTFSARFSCQYRHYKYFFPASPDLDVSRMRDAAARLVGTHDFRNLCTIDGSKQIDNYNREIRRANISLVRADESDMDAGTMHVLDLVGTAFLYNQVRSIMAILFLVGSGLEQPHIISSLLNTDQRNPLPPFRPEEPTQVVERKPSYQMADALPLVLWECGYKEEDVQWRTDEDISFSESGKAVDRDGVVMTTNLRHQCLSIYNRSRIRATLDRHFLQATACHHPPPYSPLPLPTYDALLEQSPKVILNVPLGGGTYIRTAKYKPLLERERGESAHVVNERWRLGKGKRRIEERLSKRDDSIRKDSTQLEDVDE